MGNVKIAYVSEVNSKNFADYTKTNGIVVVDLYAEWCSPCKVLSPIIDSLAAEFTEEGANIIVGKMDIEKEGNKEIVVDLGVSSIPTIIIYKNGEIVDRNTGMIQKAKLKELIQKHI